MEKATYKVEKVNLYWRYHVKKRCLWGWRYLFGRDSLADCEEELARWAGVGRGTIKFYDARGIAITDSKDDSTEGK